jgi:hypothetical protein
MTSQRAKELAARIHHVYQKANDWSEAKEQAAALIESALAPKVAVGMDAEDATNLEKFAEEALNGNRGCVTQRQAKSILYLLYAAPAPPSQEGQ